MWIGIHLEFIVLVLIEASGSIPAARHILRARISAGAKNGPFVYLSRLPFPFSLFADRFTATQHWKRLGEEF